jgi:hypothetical protein
MERTAYGPALAGLLAGAVPPGSQAEVLSKLFQRCFAVTGLLWARSPQAHATLAANGIAAAVTARLMGLFGPAVTVTLQPRTGLLPEEFRPGLPERFFPYLIANGNVALLLLLENLIVEDAYRLVGYFAESSFDWQADHVGSVALYLNRCLVARPDGPVLIGGYGQNPPVQLTWLTNPNDPQAHLLACAKEEYPVRFWGNIEDLRDKVLQALHLLEPDFEARLQTPAHLAGALAFLCRQAWHGFPAPNFANAPGAP